MIPIRSPLDIRIQNTLNVLIEIHNEGQCYRKDLAQQLDISLATVTHTCNKLANIGFLEYATTDVATNGRGRIAHLVTLSRGRIHIPVLDLSCAKMAELRLLELDGSTVFQINEEISSNVGDFIQRLHAKYQEAYSAHDIQARVAALSTIISGIFNPQTGQTLATVAPCFERVPLKELLENCFGLKVLIENESNAIALGKALKRTERETVLYLHLNEGVGLGIFMDDSLFKGEHGFGPEICCIPLPIAADKAHFCGSLYCAEGHLSLAALQDARQRGQLGQKAKLLGQLLGNLLNLLDTRKVYLGGQGLELLKNQIDQIEQGLADKLLLPDYRDIEVIPDQNFAEVLREGAFYQGLLATFISLNEEGRGA